MSYPNLPLSHVKINWVLGWFVAVHMFSSDRPFGRSEEKRWMWKVEEHADKPFATWKRTGQCTLDEPHTRYKRNPKMLCVRKLKSLLFTCSLVHDFRCKCCSGKRMSGFLYKRIPESCRNCHCFSTAKVCRSKELSQNLRKVYWECFNPERGCSLYRSTSVFCSHNEYHEPPAILLSYF